MPNEFSVRLVPAKMAGVVSPRGGGGGGGVEGEREKNVPTRSQPMYGKRHCIVLSRGGVFSCNGKKRIIRGKKKRPPLRAYGHGERILWGPFLELNIFLIFSPLLCISTQPSPYSLSYSTFYRNPPFFFCKMPKEYLLVFAYVPELAVYRISELQACAQIFNTTVTVVSEDSGAMGCFVRAEFENDAVAAQIASRMILLKGVFEVWGEAVDYPELIKNIQSFDPTVRSQYKSASFKFVFEAFGAKVTFSEKVERFNKFSDVGLDGPVEMTKPEQVFWVLEDRGIPTTNKKSHNEMVKVLFARQVGVGARRMLDTHSLKTRAYIGTTTMVPELCMLMANIALVQKGSFVWDPFCGTGSVLVSASHFGAVSFGSDLDGRALGCKGM